MLHGARYINFFLFVYIKILLIFSLSSGGLATYIVKTVML